MCYNSTTPPGIPNRRRCAVFGGNQSGKSEVGPLRITAFRAFVSSDCANKHLSAERSIAPHFKTCTLIVQSPSEMTSRMNVPPAGTLVVSCVLDLEQVELTPESAYEPSVFSTVIMTL